MDNFTTEEIDLFIDSYTRHVVENPLLNQKIPIWVEFLKTKKYYQENGMEEDYFFKKRFGITNDDLLKIRELINRIKNGKSLDRRLKTKIKGNAGIDALTGMSSFSQFSEEDEYENKPAQFEMLAEIQDAMDAYQNKMKKQAYRRNWKQSQQTSRNWHPEGSVSGVPDRYYDSDMFSEKPQISYDVQAFAKTGLMNMNKTNQIQKLEKINNILNYNDLITNDFDEEYKRSVPNLACKKKVQFTNDIDTSINAGDQDLKNMDVGAARFWQDQDILFKGPSSTDKNRCVPNKNPFEHQFQYLDANYNRVPDPRLMGQSSRNDNRSMFRR
jgi:hypothetical protein